MAPVGPMLPPLHPLGAQGASGVEGLVPQQISGGRLGTPMQCVLASFSNAWRVPLGGVS